MRAEFVAVVDADYPVMADFLKSALERCREGIDFVQFGQPWRHRAPVCNRQLSASICLTSDCGLYRIQQGTALGRVFREQHVHDGLQST